VNPQRVYRIVLADDQREVRRALRTFLERDGHFDIVGEAADGREAVDLAVEERPDAMILDLAMPGLDGLAALPMLTERAPDTAIIVLSSMVPFGDNRATALDLGAAEVFDKHIPPKKLIRSLKGILK
jgi:DNA-binding NarL/FixJ family response regulator